VIATSSSTGCATVGSEEPPSACPPVVAYSRAEQIHVAEEIAALPEGAWIVDWLADYALLRGQLSVCQSHVTVWNATNLEARF
jgi:hypothetical protein